MRILVEYNDSKSNSWSLAAKAAGIGEIKPHTRSPILTPLAILKSVISRNYIQTYCFRYLNDYPSLLKTVIRLVSEATTILICKFTGIDIIWICHNVDRESIAHYPKIANIRRRLVTTAACKILVTDHLLIPHASATLDVPTDRISMVSFGLSPAQTGQRPTSDADFAEMINWVKSRRARNKNTKIGLWIGEVSQKKVSGLLEILPMVRRAKEQSMSLCFVVIGDTKEALEAFDPDILAGIENSDDVLIIPKHMEVDPAYWSELADFVWKPLDDLSIPLTVYRACEADLPLLTLPNSFLAKYVQHYGVGLGVDATSITELFQYVDGTSSVAAREFLASRTWLHGASALIEAATTARDREKKIATKYE